MIDEKFQDNAKKALENLKATIEWTLKSLAEKEVSYYSVSKIMEDTSSAVYSLGMLNGIRLVKS